MWLETEPVMSTVDYFETSGKLTNFHAVSALIPRKQTVTMFVNINADKRLDQGQTIEALESSGTEAAP